MSYLLSICIATYNTGDRLYNTVKEIIDMKDDEIQVVVSDNASIDNTLTCLHQIKSYNLKILTSDINLGPTFNYVKALMGGDGKYIVFMTDKDKIFASNLQEIKQILKNLDISAGYFELNVNESKNYVLLEPGYESIKRMAYLSKHPTGYLFNKEKLHSLEIHEKFSQTSNVQYFPFEFILAELAIMGSCVIFHEMLFSTAKLEKNTYSKTYSGENNNLFFYPDKRLEMLVLCRKHLESLELKRQEIFYISIVLFKRYFILATDIYYNYRKDELLCSHYKIPQIDIKPISRIREGIRFTFKFFTLTDLFIIEKIIDIFFAIKITIGVVIKSIIKEIIKEVKKV